MPALEQAIEAEVRALWADTCEARGHTTDHMYFLDGSVLRSRCLTCHPAPYRRCEHGFHHPPWQHSCDGCWCEGERDRAEYGWPHDTTPARTWDEREDNR